MRMVDPVEVLAASFFIGLDHDCYEKPEAALVELIRVAIDEDRKTCARGPKGCDAELADLRAQLSCLQHDDRGVRGALRIQVERLRESLAWAIRIIDHELPPQPDPRGDEGEMQSQYYFFRGMREARALLSETASETTTKQGEST